MKMKMNFNFKESFKNKKFKYGGYATLMTIVLIAIVVIINLLFTKLDYKADFTKNKLYSLSDQTFKALDKLKSNVTIYGFYESGKEDPTTTAILGKYSGYSKKVHVQYIDPVKQPQFVQKYSVNGDTISNGTIVVESGDKFKVIQASDLVNYTQDSSGNSTPDSLAAEQRVTGAIMFVDGGQVTNIFTLSGHNEDTLTQDFTNQFNVQNFNVADINLLTKDANLSSGSILIVDSPKKDLSIDEETKIKAFLSNGGKALFMMDVLKEDMPNFKDLMNGIGININKSIVVEGNANQSTSNPVILLPQLMSHDILNAMISKSETIIVPDAQPIETVKVKKSTTTVTPLLVTSASAWAKTNLNATTLDKETGDLNGPFNIAVAITDTQDSNESRVVVVGSSVFTQAAVATASKGANVDFLMNSLNWIRNDKDSITITPKSLAAETITISGLQTIFYSGVVIIVIPVAIAIMGVSVWLRRKNK
jgi:ABC-2 type transport system permease protein